MLNYTYLESPFLFDPRRASGVDRILNTWMIVTMNRTQFAQTTTSEKVIVKPIPSKRFEFKDQQKLLILLKKLMIQLWKKHLDRFDLLLAFSIFL